MEGASFFGVVAAIGVVLALVGLPFAVDVYLRRHPLNDDEVRRLAWKRRRNGALSIFAFSVAPQRVHPAEKKAMRSRGEFVDCDLHWREMPSRVAALLKFKKHEWVVIAFVRSLRVRLLWWNKGPDGTQVWSLLPDDEVKRVLRRHDCDAVAVLHNHPKPDPSRYRMNLPSRRDLHWAAHWRQMLAKEDVSLLKFVCERGVPYLYFASFADSVLSVAPIVREIVAENDLSAFRNYGLRVELGRRTLADRVAGEDQEGPVGRVEEGREAEEVASSSVTGGDGLERVESVVAEAAQEEDGAPSLPLNEPLFDQVGQGACELLGSLREADVAATDGGEREGLFGPTGRRRGPQTLREYVGQRELVEVVEDRVRAALSRGDALEHVLLIGAPGLGKRTLARVIVREMGADLRVSYGSGLERAGDLAVVLTNLEPDDVLFIDEIHRLGPTVAEVLDPAMDDFRLDLVIGRGPAARTVRIDLPRFTLIGVTRSELVTPTLRARFGIVHEFDFYAPHELRIIIERLAKVLDVRIDQGGAEEIAARSRGTPRTADRLLRRVRDYAEVKANGRIDRATAKRALLELGIDRYGLDDTDRRILYFLIERDEGGPTSLEALSASIGEDRETITDLHEPYLVRAGFLQRHRHGLVATSRARRAWPRLSRMGP